MTRWGSPTGLSLIDALDPPPTKGLQLSASVTNLIINPGASGTATITVQ